MEGSPLYNPETRTDPTKISNAIRAFLESQDLTHLEEDGASKYLTAHGVTDLLKFAPVVADRGRLPFPYGWNRGVVPVPPGCERFIYLRDLVKFVQASEHTGSFVPVKIGDIKGNKVTKSTRRSVTAKTCRVSEAGDILVPMLMPIPAKIVQSQDRYLLDIDALEALRPVDPSIGSKLYAYLADPSASTYFYAQVALKLTGFKATYQRIKPSDLGMVRIPVGVLGPLPSSLSSLVHGPALSGD